MKKTIAVFFGGQSVEHDVSIITAHTPIISSLLATGQFDVWPVYIAKNGSWYCDKTMNDLSFFKTDNLDETLSKLKPIHLSLNNGLTIVWPGFRSRQVAVDMAFPSMHGTFGEDGSLMGLLRMANIPFVGCDLFASSVAMDKVLTKQILESEGLPIVPYVWCTKYDGEQNKALWNKKIGELTYPLFVKPVHLGSSIGITKINDSFQLENALEVAFHYDDKVLIEQSIENLIEVTLPIMGNETLTCAAIERPLNKTEFFDFNDKYMSGGKKSSSTPYSELPAHIPETLATQVRDLGKEAYHILGCTGIARIDFLIDSVTSKIYINEVNTLPGSLYHHNWKTVGVSNVDLVSRLVALAQERFDAQKNTTYTFHSDVLKQSGGGKA